MVKEAKGKGPAKQKPATNPGKKGGKKGAHACPRCDSTFGRPSNRDQHVRTVHEKRKDHVCPQCAAAFGTAGNLTKHVRTVHEKRKDHVCPQCAAAFGAADSLTVHVRTVHEKRKDHVCPQCAAAFGAADGLTVHVRTVHEKRKDHVCPQCAAAFGTASNLAKHVHAVHTMAAKSAHELRQYYTACPAGTLMTTRVLDVLTLAELRQYFTACPPGSEMSKRVLLALTTAQRGAHARLRAEAGSFLTPMLVSALLHEPGGDSLLAANTLQRAPHGLAMPLSQRAAAAPLSIAGPATLNGAGIGDADRKQLLIETARSAKANSAQRLAVRERRVAGMQAAIDAAKTVCGPGMAVAANPPAPPSAGAACGPAPWLSCAAVSALLGRPGGDRLLAANTLRRAARGLAMTLPQRAAAAPLSIAGPATLNGAGMGDADRKQLLIETARSAKANSAQRLAVRERRVAGMQAAIDAAKAFGPG